MSGRPFEPGHYPLPVHLLLLPAAKVLFGISSSLSRDATLVLKWARPRPRVLHPENIPPDSPFVLVVNHYDRPGLGAWFGVAVVTGAVARRRVHEPREIHFAMAREWWYPSGFGRAFKQPFTAWLFGRLAATYGLIRLPPVLDREEFRGQGAPEIRRALALTHGACPQLVGLAPEGRTGEGLGLCQPPAGAGRLVLLLSHDAVPILPVGLYEEPDGALTANFGATVRLDLGRVPRSERDARVTRKVMVEIGKLLPERMWGAYHDEIAKARAGNT